MVFYLLRAQPPPLSYFYGVSDNYGASVYRGETVQPGSHLSPASKDVLIPWSSAAAAAKHFSCIQLFVTPWTVACQVPLSTEFSKQEYWLLLLLSHFSLAQLCATPETAAHQAPPSLGFSRQEYWSGLPFPSPMHESEK